MTPNPITVAPEASLAEIAKLLEKNKIKRVPVVEDNVILGIVSRANLLHGLVALNPQAVASSQDDRSIRKAIQQAISEGARPSGAFVNVLVQDGVVHLIGTVASSREEQAILVAIESVPGVRAVENELGRVPTWAFGY